MLFIKPKTQLLINYIAYIVHTTTTTGNFCIVEHNMFKNTVSYFYCLIVVNQGNKRNSSRYKLTAVSVSALTTAAR